jgi:hypothetical protein
VLLFFGIRIDNSGDGEVVGEISSARSGEREVRNWSGVLCQPFCALAWSCLGFVAASPDQWKARWRKELTMIAIATFSHRFRDEVGERG